MFKTPQIVLFSSDIARASEFYRALGFEEVFRTPSGGTPIHIDLALDGYRLGLSSEASTRDDHGLDRLLIAWAEDPDGHLVQVVQQTDR